MKTRTLLFGAGSGARIYMKNTGHYREFVAILDNDEKKFHTKYDDIPIYPPDSWAQHEFDQIIITTQWALDVKKQLIHDLKVPAYLVQLPQKAELKLPAPFEDPATLSMAQDIIVWLNRAAVDAKIPMVIDFGTLLGLVRDKGLIPWDDDIDFSAPVDCAKQMEAMLRHLITQPFPHPVNWQLEKLSDKSGFALGFLLHFSSDETPFRQFITSISFREISKAMANHLPTLGMWYAPEKHFKSCEQLEVLGTTIQVPAHYLDYLEFVYGKDWRKPKKNMMLSDYAHIRQTDFTRVQDAAIKSQAVT
jgi:hypothetical protein